MATENIFTVQLNTSGEMPQPFDVKVDCKDGVLCLVGDDKPRDFGEVIILPICHVYKNSIMYNVTNFPNSTPADYYNIYFVSLTTGNVFSALVKKSSEGSYKRFMQGVLAFGKPSDVLKTKVTFSFREDTFKGGKSKTLVFNEACEATPEQVEAIMNFFAAAEPMHVISLRNVNQYCEANGLDLDETLPTLLGYKTDTKKQITENGTK